MKKTLLSAVSLVALLAATSYASAANNEEHHTQDGNDTATIDQIGSDNQIGVDNDGLVLEVRQQSGANELTIRQEGDGNQITRAFPSENGTSGNNKNSYQDGGSVANITQTGDLNRIRRFVQNGASNELTYEQTGTNNGRIGRLVNSESNNTNINDTEVMDFVEIASFGGLPFNADGTVATRASQVIQDGDDNTIDLVSGTGGEYNGASVAQLGSNNQVRGNGGAGAFAQDGNRNLLLAMQEGSNNTLFGGQLGDDNVMAVSSEGGDNVVNASQDGNLNTLFNLQQGGSNRLDIGQSGDSNFARVNQTTNGNLSTITQSGGDNTSVVQQN